MPAPWRARQLVTTGLGTALSLSMLVLVPLLRLLQQKPFSSVHRCSEARASRTRCSCVMASVLNHSTSRGPPSCGHAPRDPPDLVSLCCAFRLSLHVCPLQRSPMMYGRCPTQSLSAAAASSSSRFCASYAYPSPASQQSAAQLTEGFTTKHADVSGR